MYTLQSRLIEKVVYELIPGIRSTLMDAISVYMGLPVKSVEYREEPTGLYIVVIVDNDARSVLELWLRVADKLRGLGPVIVKWSGETNVTPTELGRHLCMIFAKMGVYLSMSSSFNAVKLLRKG